MNGNPARAEAERLLHEELKTLVAQVKATIDKEEAAWARIRDVLRELDALKDSPPSDSPESPREENL
jgi:hypothetical protein